MDTQDWLLLLVYVGVLVALVKPLGAYMARVYEGRSKWLGFIERPIYRLLGIRTEAEQSWKQYAIACLLFNLVGLLFVYVIQRTQAWLPLNPQSMANVSPDSAFNTAVSFASNTNWQGYGGESTMSHLTQMLALGVQNFVSAATGMAVLVALTRGIARRSSATIGHFYVDLVRSTLYILLPLSIVLAIFLVSQGVVQTFTPYATVDLIQPSGENTTQNIAIGPAASQVAIKQLGTNGGGFFNVNSAHPLENPTPLSNFVQLLAILLIPAALCYTYGRLVNDTRQGWAILCAMLAIFIPMTIACAMLEAQPNPHLAELNITGGNMEGKEARFGTTASALWAVATTAASNGSVNSMHDSFSPLGGLIPMWLMQLGEVVFGGVGSGLYGMLIFVILAVFIAGLMVGRTPEYLGKKIEAHEMKLASLVILIPCAAVLIGTAVACVFPATAFDTIGFVDGAPAARISNPGPHGFSQILYWASSTGNNNGSAFAGLSANNPFYNLTGGLLMLIARYWILLPVLALAGSLASKKTVPPSERRLDPGTLPTHTPLFVTILIGVVLLVGALTFVPALALGPIAEQLMVSAK